MTLGEVLANKTLKCQLKKLENQNLPKRMPHQRKSNRDLPKRQKRKNARRDCKMRKTNYEHLSKISLPILSKFIHGIIPFRKREFNVAGESSSKRSRLVDVNKVLYVDSYILNYSTFFPGKLLGSTLNVGNLSACE
jgi:hypothetical protein